MTRRFLFSLFFFCVTIGMMHVELNGDGFCNPNFNPVQNPAIIGGTHTIPQRKSITGFKRHHHISLSYGFNSPN